jgi:hypothetical protein
MTGLELCNVPDPRENQNKLRSRHQITEGFSRKWDEVRGVAPVGLYSMTAGIAIQGYRRLPWNSSN